MARPTPYYVQTSYPDGEYEVEDCPTLGTARAFAECIARLGGSRVTIWRRRNIRLADNIGWDWEEEEVTE